MDHVNSFINFEIFAQMKKVFNSLLTLYNPILLNFAKFHVPNQNLKSLQGWSGLSVKKSVGVQSFAHLGWLRRTMACGDLSD